MNRTELKIIIKHFNSACCRLLQSDKNDYIDDLKRFISFLDSKEIINNYIQSCCCTDENVEETVSEVLDSYGRTVFFTGYDKEEEVRNVYTILKYISQKFQRIPQGLFIAYRGGSNKNSHELKNLNIIFKMFIILNIEY